jgi:hypothetical protein
VTRLQAEVQHLQAQLTLESQRRRTAEDAFDVMRQQSLPLRDTLTALRTDAVAEAAERYRVLELNTTLCAEGMQGLAVDIKRAFGYVPVHIINKIEKVCNSAHVCLSMRLWRT